MSTPRNLDIPPEFDVRTTSTDRGGFASHSAVLGTTVTVLPDSAHSPAVENPTATAETLDQWFASN